MFWQSLHRSLLCVLLLPCGVLTAPATAQDDKPRLMLNTGGPVGGLRAVAFSGDGTQLYAAGSGKVVNVWNLTRRANAIQAIPAEPLRWEIARGMRGRINTLDLAGGEGPLAIGGFSARGASGDLVLFDPRRRQIEALLPPQRDDVAASAAPPGHVQSVGAVDFSPDGRHLVSVSIDGEVRLWTLGGESGSAILQAAAGVEDGLIRTAAFVADRRLIVPVRDAHQPAAWRLSLVDPDRLDRPATVLSGPVFWYGVGAIADTADGGEFAAADLTGRVTLFSNGASPVARPLNRPQQQSGNAAARTVAALAYNPQRLLAITTTADAEGLCWLELWDTAGNPPRLVLERPMGRGEHAASARFSPDGSLLAATRADRGAVELIPVGGGNAPLDVDRTILLSGRGREPGRVQFVGNEGYRIAIDSPLENAVDAPVENDRLLFDLQTLEVIRTPDDRIPAESRPVDSSGWRIVAQPLTQTVQRLQVIAPRAATPRCSIELQTVHQGTYRLHTWLTDAQGRVDGVAIATDRQDGIFLYDLPAGGQCRLLRYLRDHSDTIRSLSVSADGRYLVSSAADQTVKVWSLAGLRNVNAGFPREAAWGATFAIENGRVVVQSAIGPGIAVHRDLLADDVITRAQYAGPGGTVTATDSSAILLALAERPLWETLVLTSARDGQPREPIVVTPAWEPLATLFVDRSREWALWTPQGVYDASAGGDRLFGWHINVGREADPQYVRAEQFRRDLEKPEVMRQLLIRGSLQDALIALAAAPPRTIGEVAADIPRVRLISPRSGDAIGRGETIAVEAAVRFPDDPDFDADNCEPKLWINQRDGGAPQSVRQVDGESVYTWNVPPADEQNRVTLRVQEIPGAVDARFSDTWVQVAADVPPQDVTLHLFALSAENYTGDMRLPYCNDTALGVAELLQQHQGKRYKVGQVRVVNDEEGPHTLNRVTVRRQIAAIRTQLQQIREDDLADDLLVVFVSGHGEAFASEYFFVPPHAEVTENLDERLREQVLRRVGIPWEDLRSLADINCRKLFLLDTCHAGNVADAEKASRRTLEQSRALVVSAVSQDGTAIAEGPNSQRTLFTGFLLEACRGEADGAVPHAPVQSSYLPLREGKINLKEIVSYVGSRTRSYYQFPKCMPEELLDFVDLPLFEVPAPAGPPTPAPQQ